MQARSVFRWLSSQLAISHVATCFQLCHDPCKFLAKVKHLVQSIASYLRNPHKQLQLYDHKGSSQLAGYLAEFKIHRSIHPVTNDYGMHVWVHLSFTAIYKNSCQLAIQLGTQLVNCKNCVTMCIASCITSQLELSGEQKLQEAFMTLKLSNQQEGVIAMYS